MFEILFSIFGSLTIIFFVPTNKLSKENKSVKGFPMAYYSDEYLTNEDVKYRIILIVLGFGVLGVPVVGPTLVGLQNSMSLPVPVHIIQQQNYQNQL